MVEPHGHTANLTEADLEFLIEATTPGARGRGRLREAMSSDAEIRRAVVTDPRVFQRIANDEEAFVKVSPTLYFEILLRQARRDVEIATHTTERLGRETIPVFDTRNVAELLASEDVVEYLARMLASFTRTHSYAVAVRVKPGVLRRQRYSDLDFDGLVRLCAATDEPHRFDYYKRIADVCLFLSAIFPDHASPEGARAERGRRLQDYEVEGPRFYGLAEGHPTARALELADVFALLRERFVTARKSLSFLAGQYLHSRRQHLFSGPSV